MPHEVDVKPGSSGVVFVLPNLGFGGAQRVASLVANELVKEGHRVTIVLTSLSSTESKPLHDLDPLITVLQVGEKWSSKWSVLDRVPVAAYLTWRLRQVLSTLSLRRSLSSLSPSTVVSFLVSANVWTVLATRGTRHRVVISERNDPERQTVSRFYRFWRRRLYRFADQVTSNSKLSEEVCRRHFGVPSTLVVPNVISPVSPRIFEDSYPRRLVFVGRLVRQKDVPTLLRAMRILVERDPGWTLDVVGDGPEMTSLKSLARSLAIDGNVVFHGFLSDPSPVMARASVLIQPSLHEGTPNAVLEAMALGIPCLVSDSSPGPRSLAGKVASELVFRTGDEFSLLGSLAFATSGPEQIERLGTRSGEVAAEHEWRNVRSVWLRCLGIDETLRAPTHDTRDEMGNRSQSRA